MNKTIIYLGDYMEIWQVLFRTAFFYFYVILCYRLMGKREIGQLGVIDLMVSILIAELIAISIENIKDSIILTIAPIALLVVLEIVLAFISIKSRQRYSMDNLLLSLRQKEIKNIEDVEYAFLEPNGKLSIFKYNMFKIPSSYPMPLILDGSLQEKALKYIHKTKTWLEYTLNSKNIKVEDIFYCFYKNKKLYIIKRNDLK